MPPHLALLLLAAPDMEITLPVLLSAAALAFAVWNFFRKESREDGQTSSQRLKKIEGRLDNHDVQRQAEVQARERLAEDMRRDTLAVREEADRRCKALEKAAEEIPRLRDLLNELRADVKRLPGIETDVKEMNALLLKFLSEK